MQSLSQPISLSEKTFVILRDLIHERTGVHYPEANRELLAEKLRERVIAHQFSSFLDYYYLLKYDAGAATEWHYVMDALSVPETFFWREADQIQALVQILVPQHFAAHPNEPLRIWSAACATGEEPLSIAIALNEAGWLKQAPIEIYASDASPKAIATAQAGLYRERSFRSLDPTLQGKYFRQEKHSWRIDPAIHQHIHWAIANLTKSAEIAPFTRASVIFCRNVFIYFSDPMIRKIATQFFEQMASPGYLFLGAAESLLNLNTPFEFREMGGAFVYVKS